MTRCFLRPTFTIALCALVVGLLLIGTADNLSGTALAPDTDELKLFPLDARLPGNPPVGGVRYWTEPFQPLPCEGCYVSVIHRKVRGGSRYELWQNTWGEPGAAERQIVVGRGPALDRLAPPATILDGRSITDVPDPAAPATSGPKRGFTRPYMAYYPDCGYVLLACVASDYLPGAVPLLPAILTSKSGEAGRWTYHGKLTGDPATEAAARKIWSDGGSIVRLDKHRWRIYCNGFGPSLTALESNGLAGPWRFLREPSGGLRELLPHFRAATGGGCFPYILRVAKDEWHCWITDKWPPQSIWHYYSRDGLSWEPYGQQPEITRALVNGRGIKCLRAYVDPDGKSIVGLLSVWTPGPDGTKRWQLHTSRLPVGPPPGK
jgi:hypothetical protein